MFKRKRKKKSDSEESTDSAVQQKDLKELQELLGDFGQVMERINRAGEAFMKASLRMQLGMKKFHEANEKLKNLKTQNN
ncbi:MAG: hypothetical protein ACXACI_17885 [Candidatus Hodarchaeales archaeon]